MLLKILETIEQWNQEAFKYFRSTSMLDPGGTVEKFWEVTVTGRKEVNLRSDIL